MLGILAAFLALRPSADGQDARRATAILVDACVETVSVVDGLGVSSTTSDVAHALDSPEVARF